MSGAINFGIIDPNTPLKAANAFYDGQQEVQKNALAKLQLEAAQGQNELAKYGLSKARREDESQNALTQALQRGDDPYQTLLKAGRFKDAGEFQKSGAETNKTKAETNVKNLELVKHFATAISANPNPEYASKTLDYLEQLTGLKLDNDRAELAKMTDPEQIKRWAYSHSLKADQMLPKFDKADNGQTIQYVDTNPLTNPNPQPVQKFATPGEKLSAAKALEIARMNDARVKEGQAAEESRFNRRTAQEKTQIVPTDDGVYIVNKGTGVSTPVSKSDGKPLLPKGSPMYDGENKFNSALRTIEEAKTLLPKATGSMIGRGVDVGASVFGKTTKGAEASDALKVLSGALISGVPRFKGSDSDKDVAIYKQLAGNVGDETIPYERRLASLKQVETMLRSNAAQKGFVEKPTGGSIHDQADAILNGGK